MASPQQFKDMLEVLADLVVLELAVHTLQVEAAALVLLVVMVKDLAHFLVLLEVMVVLVFNFQQHLDRQH